MKVIVGMDSFKGSLSSKDSNRAVENGIRSIFKNAEVKSYLMADGGEGTVEALIDGFDGEHKYTDVTGPLGDKISVSYGLVEKESLAIIEIAEACGLTLINKDRLAPWSATTYGVGEMIEHAYENGAKTFIIGLGGSATNDGGVGMLQAMGYDFLDENDQQVEFGGKALSNIHKIIKTEKACKFDECEFRIACDVNNVLYGTDGATYIYGPQKGVTESMLEPLDEAVKHYAEMTGKQMNIDISSIEGGGAAGGLGAAFHGYLNAELKSGIGLIIEILNVEEEIRDADLVITGEGRLDAQTSMGKVPAGLAESAKKYEVPVIAFGGSLTDDAYELVKGDLNAIFSIQHSPVSLEEAMDSVLTGVNLEKTVSQVMSVININIT